MNNEKKKFEPLFHLSKRDNLPLWKSILFRVGSILIALLVSGIFISASAKKSFFGVYKSLFVGAFGGAMNVGVLFQEMALLLCVGLALSLAFKMKFWNLGGNGQILMGCLASAMCMYFMGTKAKLSDGIIIPVMFITSILAGAIWAAIPAIFKAFFKTNESLFTLMMNYIAVGLVDYFIAKCFPRGSGIMPPTFKGNLPQLGNKYVLPILIVAVVTAVIFVYMKYSKQGYEISVVGDSENTAKYIGINVKKVIIRTLILSGALCGMVGFLITGGISYTVNSEISDNRGFTAIIVAWLAKFDPLIMILTSFFIAFLSRGMAQVRTDFGFTNKALSNIVIALIYFFIIGCEFFISYKLSFKKKEGGKK